jgi:hypothetical protein
MKQQKQHTGHWCQAHNGAPCTCGPPKIDLTPNWDATCENCGEKPTVGRSRLCGPCYFGEADAAGGNW